MPMNFLHGTAMPHSFEEKLARLHALRRQTLEGGGADKIAKIHASGRLTARERIHLLLLDEAARGLDDVEAGRTRSARAAVQGFKRRRAR